MKRIITTLFALGSLTMGDTLVNVMQTGNTGASTSTSGTATTDVWGVGDLNLTDVTVSVDITGPNSARNAWTKNYATSIFSINGTDIGNGGTFTYTLTFTTRFADGVGSINLSSLTFDIFTLDAAGNTQNTALQQINCDYVLKQGENTLVSTSILNHNLYGTGYSSTQGSTAAYTYNDDGTYTLGRFADEGTSGSRTLLSGGQVTMDFNQPLTLEDNTTYSLTMDFSRASATEFYLGFGNIAFNGESVTATQPLIPEPASTTLSVLALAGLALRRRRASR